MDEVGEAFGMRPQDTLPHQSARFDTAESNTTQNSSAHSEDPLVIDLDGTLLQTNVLLECALVFLKRNPLGIFQMLVWLMRGRAVLKQELARRVTLDAAALPVNTALEAFAAAEKDRGRKVYLATAADRSIAQSIADRCGFFDGVLASDGLVNLKGRRKLEALRLLFPAGFAYAGDSSADFPVWSRASEVILVGESHWTRRTARRFDKPTQTFPTPSRLAALLKCARPHQWAKNCLVFVPAILGGVLSNPHAMLACALGFLALCFTASSTYIMNDLWDVADDRRHWSKCKRPIASGKLPVSTALAAIPAGLAIGMLLAIVAAPKVSLVLLGYVLLTVSYSFYLKRVPVLDVIVLASLFTLRLLLGIVCAGVFASPWLLVFSMFLFSSLCFAKRYVEVERAAGHGQNALASRGYVAKDGPLIFALGLGTGIASIIIMVLYVMFDAFRQTFYGDTIWLWAFPIIIFLWFARVWLVAARGELNDDPVAFAVNDVPSIMLGGAILTAFLLAWSGTFG
jgi:4-hydroxybenzoate polyprenyltransferase/phosphoserine phosphatase